MTIEYKDSKRIVGLSTDYNTTPTETNDFSTTATESKSGSSISIHGGVLGGDYVPTGSSQCSTVDPLGTTLSNTSWVARFKLTINTITNPSSETNLASIGFFATNGASGSGNEDSIIMAFWNNSSGSKQIRLGYTNNSFPASLTDKVTFTKQMAVETLYIELVRISDTSCKASLYSDSGYSSLIESQTLSISAGVCTNLRYFGGKNWNRSALNGVHDIDVDDLYIWNNTSTSPLLPKSALIDVQDNSLLVEKDNARRYWFSERGADTTSGSLQSSFDNDSKIENGASQYDFVGQKFLSGHSLIGQSISSISFWLWNIGSGSTTGATYSYGVFDSNGNLKGDVFGTLNVSDITQASSYTGATKRTMTTSSPVTIEANDFIGIRTNQALTSTAYDIEIGSGGNGSIENNAERVRGSAGSVTPDSNRDVAYEVIHATPATWTMQPTYQTDFSSSTGWTFKDSAKASISGGSLSFDFEDNSGDDDSCYYDLGSTMSDTKWLLRFKINWTTFDDNSRCWFGLASNTTSQNVAKDFIGLLTHKFSGTANWESMDKSNASLDYAGENSSSTTISTSTDYWVQIRRLTDTTYDIKVYDDSDYTSLVDTVTGTMSASSISGLRYIMFYNRNDHETTYNQVGTIDDLSFYNGVTSIN